MKIKCPGCSKVLSIPESAAGKIVKCPCGKQLRAPAATGAPTGAAPTGPAPTGAASGPPAAPRPMPTPGRAATNQPAPGQPAAKRPTQAPVAPTGFDGAGFFDEMTESDLAPVKAVNMPGKAEVRDRSASAKALQQYTSPASTSTGPSGGRDVGSMTLASPGSRIVATLIDGLLYAVFAGIAVAVAIALFGAEALDEKKAGEGPDFAFFGFSLGIYLISQLINITLISISGQSVGKKVMGIRMVNSQTGVNASFGDGWFVRNFVFAFLTGIPLIGLVIVIIDIVRLFMDRHETLHDKLASTMVVQNNP